MMTLSSTIKRLTTVAAFGLAASLSSIVSASPMSDYNLILFGDYNYEGGEVEGRTILGGSLNADNHSPTFATRETTVAFKDTVYVVDDLNAMNINLNAGSIVYGGDYNVAGNINLNGGGSSVQSVTQGDQAAMQASVNSIESTLRGDSAYFASLAGNGSLLGSHLSYTGSDALAVFDVDASDIFAQNNSLSLDAGAASTVVINVSGSNVNVGGGVNLTGNGFSLQANSFNLGAANILWNFHEALTIDFNNLATVGSVLAVDADIVGGAVFDGTVAAQSYTGGREFHRFGFEWIPPVKVPEAPVLGLLLAGLGLTGLARLKQSSTTANA